jgi:hypothetical protein
METNLPGYRPYQRPDGMPVAAPGITVYSYRSDSRRRVFTVEGLPADWPKRKCPVCGGKRRRARKVCRSCSANIRRIMVPLTCCYCGVQFERILSEHDKMHRRGHTDVYCPLACSQAHHAIKNRRPCVVCAKRCPTKTRKYCSKACRASRGQKELQPKQCAICGETFAPKSRRIAYCSRKCADEAHSRRMRGAGNSHYKWRHLLCHMVP